MKERTCRKCGKKYDANYMACPHCGNNPYRNAFQGVLIGLCVFMLIAGFANSIVLLVNQKKMYESLSSQIASISGGNTSGQSESEGVNLADYPEILEKYAISDSTDLKTLGDDYFLYFYQDGCVNCEISNQFIASYYYLGVNDTTPIYLAYLNECENLFSQFDVEGTPTLVRMTANQQVSKVSGYDAVYEVLDPIVREYTGE